MEAAFRDCVIEAQHDGRTILLSSHLLAEAEALSDRVTIIRHGKTVETGTLAGMRHLTRVSVEAELSAPPALGGMPGVHELTATGTMVRCRVDHAALDKVVGRLHQAGIRSLTCRPPTLEELFLRHYSPVPDRVPSARGAVPRRRDAGRQTLITARSVDLSTAGAHQPGERLMVHSGPPRKRRVSTPHHCQYIAHRGACGKTPMGPHNRRRHISGPELMPCCR